MALSVKCLVVLMYGVSSVQQNPFIWPLPSTHEISNDLAYNVDSAKFEFSTDSNSKILAEAFDRYNDLIFPHRPEGSGDPAMQTIAKMIVKVGDDSGDMPFYGMDESYTLSVAHADDQTPTLTANTVWGALRGLETFSQMVRFNSSLNYYQTYTHSISDAPRFSHRGILIDTSRHFQSVSSIKSVLDAMSYAKFNVLHWVCHHW